MISWLVALSVASAPAAIEQVEECGDILPLKWETSLWRDSGDGLFTQESFAPQTEWTAPEGDVTGAALVLDCFGTSTPRSSDVLIHHYPPALFTTRRTRPVLLVTGAGDNALRSMSFLAVSLSHQGFHSYALTFAHRHGDNFQQAEQIANALAVISELHPGVKIDAVAYSKGGVALRIYASNVTDADWRGTHDAYQTHSTRYRGDLGRVVFLGSPQAGVDTPFRWSATNLFAANGEPIDAPGSWLTYYPGTSANLFWTEDLAPHSLFVEGGNHFPGQAQMLADLRSMHALPGGNPSLGLYANQPDYLTTYIGGLGFVSNSPGIARAISEGGNAIEKLQSEGLAPDIDFYLAAGGNPIMGVGALDQSLYESGWGDLDAAERRIEWEDMVEGWIGSVFPWFDSFSNDLPRLLAGTGFLGEISGPSDGVLFIESALDSSGLASRGAELKESRQFNALNHAELVAAGTLAETFYGDRELSGGLYDPNLAEKYGSPENQIIEWVISIFSEPVPETPPEPTPEPTPTATPEPTPTVLPTPEVPPPGPTAPPTEEPTDTPSPEPTVAPTPDPTPEATAPTPEATSDPTGPSRRGKRFAGSCASADPTGAVWVLLALGLLRRRATRRGR